MKEWSSSRGYSADMRNQTAPKNPSNSWASVSLVRSCHLLRLASRPTCAPSLCARPCSARSSSTPCLGPAPPGAPSSGAPPGAASMASVASAPKLARRNRAQRGWSSSRSLPALRPLAPDLALRPARPSACALLHTLPVFRLACH
jgi:hypothetical protein